MNIERYGDAHAALRAWAGRVTGDAREVAQSQVTGALGDILSITPLADRDWLVIRFFDVVVDQNAQWVEGSMTLHDDSSKTIVLTDLAFRWERPAKVTLKLWGIPFSDHKTLAEIIAHDHPSGPLNPDENRRLRWRRSQDPGGDHRS